MILQDEVARTIAKEIQVKLTPEEHTRLSSSHTVDPEAYQLYIKGRYFWVKRTEESLRRAIAYLQQAIERDPSCAAAYSGLADCYSSLGFSFDVGSQRPIDIRPKSLAIPTGIQKVQAKSLSIPLIPPSVGGPFLIFDTGVEYRLGAQNSGLQCLRRMEILQGRVRSGHGTEVTKMNKSTLLRISYAVVAFFVLSWMPSPVFAQRGGGGHGGGGGFHGGGGGFHGGGGGFHSSAGFHGGGSFQGGRAHYGYGGSHYYGGYRGGGSYGWRGGYYGHGWRGRYWGYPGYGYGWGFGWGWPYWSPYGYGYGPWWGYPYSYYYPSCTPGYDCPSNGNDDPPPSDFGPQSKNYSPNNGAEYESSAPVLSVDRITAAPNNDLVASSTRRPEPSVPIGSIDRVVSVTPSSYRVTHHSKQHNPAVRPEVQNAMRALHEMPPFAREREIETGRYSHFSAPEKKLLRSVS